MDVSPDLCVSFPPLGMLPSLRCDRPQQRPTSLLGFKEHYEMNEWVLMGAGDILLLHTDGLTEHNSDGDERISRGGSSRSSARSSRPRPRDIFDGVNADMLAFGRPSDDISLVVIKLK